MDRRQRHPEVRVVGGAGKRIVGDADDRERLRSQAHGAPDEARVEAEARRPSAVETTATDGTPPGSSSDGTSKRPSAGFASRSVKKSPETKAVSSRAGAPRRRR